MEMTSYQVQPEGEARLPSIVLDEVASGMAIIFLPLSFRPSTSILFSAKLYSLAPASRIQCLLWVHLPLPCDSIPVVITAVL